MNKNTDVIIPWMQHALPMDTPKDSLISARRNGLPFRQDDPRIVQWSREVQSELFKAMNDEACMRLINGPEFRPSDSMAYPTIQQARRNNPEQTAAVVIGCIASVASYLRPKTTFRGEDDYTEAFEALCSQWGNFSLADFGMIFDKLRRGELVDLRFRFLLPELLKACEVFAEFKAQKTEERAKLHKLHYNEQERGAWNDLTARMGGHSAPQLTDRVQWMNGKDVLSWSEKAQMAARDNDRRNGIQS